MGDYTDRPTSEQLVDLHFYVVPPELWQERLHSAFNQIIAETISAGFLRIYPEMLLIQLRDEVEKHLGYDVIPRDYVFCKSVGRCLTQVKPKQERQMKVKYFIPPHAYCPEIFVLDSDSARRSQISSDSSHSRFSYNSLHGVGGYQNGYPHDHAGYPGFHNGNVPEYPGFGGQYHQPAGGQTTRRTQPSTIPVQNIYRNHDNISPSSSRLSGTPPNSAELRTGVGQFRNLRNSNFADEEELERLRKLAEEERRRRLEEEEEERRRLEEERRRREHEERMRLEQERLEQDRKRYDDEQAKWEAERRRREEEERRLREEEERRKREEEERRRREEEERRRRENEDNNMMGVPDLLFQEPTMINPSEDDGEKDNISERERLMRELQQMRDERAEIERRRDDLVRRAKQLQAKTQNRRNQARDLWKKRYFEEKKKTPPIDEQANQLRGELENLHRKIVGTMETAMREKKASTNKTENDRQILDIASIRVQATRIQHEIEEYQRRVDEGKMKLTAEIKLRTQAEAELRAMKAELTQKKINLTVTRSQQLAAMGTQNVFTPKTPNLTPKN